MDTASNEARVEKQEEVGITFESMWKKIYKEVRYRPKLEGRLEEVYGQKGVRGCRCWWRR